MQYYLYFTDGELTEIKVRIIHQIWMHFLRHKIGFLEPFRSYSTYRVQKTALATSTSGVFFLCLDIFLGISGV